jgi:hypothetical protein
MLRMPACDHRRPSQSGGVHGPEPLAAAAARYRPAGASDAALSSAYNRSSCTATQFQFAYPMRRVPHDVDTIGRNPRSDPSLSLFGM